MLKSILAVVAGYLVFGVSAALLFRFAGQAPHAEVPLAFMVWTTVYGMVFALVAGYVAAALAPSRPRRHAVIVAVLIAASALGSLVASPAGTSRWSQVTSLVCIAPCAALGGRLRRVG